MNESIIGVDAGDFGLGSKAALGRAAALDFRAVELPAARGELAPDNLSPSGRRHLARFARGLGLELSALSAELHGLLLTNPRTVQERIERTCQVIDLAADLGVAVVVAGAGALTHPESSEPSPLAVEALVRIGEYADRRGVSYSLRPTREGGERLLRVLDTLRCPSIGICLDPAALVMAGQNPLASVDRLIEHVRMTHVRDATAGMPDCAGQETRLGEGDVDLTGVLAALGAGDYAGPYIVRRTSSSDPTRDLSDARETLRHLLP